VTLPATCHLLFMPLHASTIRPPSNATGTPHEIAVERLMAGGRWPGALR
jgi:hypothetical protein